MSKNYKDLLVSHVFEFFSLLVTFGAVVFWKHSYSLLLILKLLLRDVKYALPSLLWLRFLFLNMIDFEMLLTFWNLWMPARLRIQGFLIYISLLILFYSNIEFIHVRCVTGKKGTSTTPEYKQENLLLRQAHEQTSFRCDEHEQI